MIKPPASIHEVEHLTDAARSAIGSRSTMCTSTVDGNTRRKVTSATQGEPSSRRAEAIEIHEEQKALAAHITNQRLDLAERQPMVAH